MHYDSTCFSLFHFPKVQSCAFNVVIVCCGNSRIHIISCYEFSSVISMTLLGKFIIFCVCSGWLYPIVPFSWVIPLFIVGALPKDSRTNPFKGGKND